MANKVRKTCKICGKMFTPCADCENDKTMFRWKRVACSPECAKEYFAKIKESRHTSYVDIQTIKPDDNLLPNTYSVSDIVTEEVKLKRTRKRNNVENKEREQID